ncbi:MAG: hypothetical protein RL607_161 [Bacteroidota bacterium]|jgi:cell division protein FtsB
MKQWYRNLIANYPILAFLGSGYFLVLIFFLVWMLFLDNYSYFDHRILDKEIDELEANKEYYQQEITKDEKSIKEMNYPGHIERYAREKYYMKRDSEDIYIIDIEEERKKDSIEGAKL